MPRQPHVGRVRSFASECQSRNKLGRLVHCSIHRAEVLEQPPHFLGDWRLGRAGVDFAQLTGSHSA